jgi:hypothetical protein
MPGCGCRLAPLTPHTFTRENKTHIYRAGLGASTLLSLKKTCISSWQVELDMEGNNLTCMGRIWCCPSRLHVATRFGWIKTSAALLRKDPWLCWFGADGLLSLVLERICFGACRFSRSCLVERICFGACRFSRSCLVSKWKIEYLFE